MRDVYLPEAQFWNLIETFTKAKPQNIFTGQFEASDFVTILGEAGGIWPESVLVEQPKGVRLQRANFPTSSRDPAIRALEALLDDDPVDDNF